MGGERKKVGKGTICREVCHIIDVLPTCLDIASVDYPPVFHGKRVEPAGTTLLPVLRNKKLRARDLFFEHQTSCAIISAEWKLVRANGKRPWELIDLSADPFEEHDLSAQYPEKVKALEKKWNDWAEQQSVFPFEYRGWTQRINFYKSLYPDQSGCLIRP